MIRAYIKGIVDSISTEYGSEYQKYKKVPEQGLTEPCFLIRCITPVTVPKLRNRATKSYTFHITYFPKDTKNPELECLEVAETLSDALQTIMVDGVAVHSSGEMSGKFVDGNLQFTVTYTVHAMKSDEPVDSMTTLERVATAVE